MRCSPQRGQLDRADSPAQEAPESHDKGPFPLVLSSSETTHQGKQAFVKSAQIPPTIPGPWAAVGTLGKTHPLQRVHHPSPRPPPFTAKEEIFLLGSSLPPPSPRLPARAESYSGQETQIKIYCSKRLLLALKPLPILPSDPSNLGHSKLALCAPV